MFGSALISGLVIGGFYSLVGAGLNLVFGVIKIINFAQGAMLTIGAYPVSYTHLTLPTILRV